MRLFTACRFITAEKHYMTFVLFLFLRTLSDCLRRLVPSFDIFFINNGGPVFVFAISLENTHVNVTFI
jgi:hypothetical protein